MNFLTFKNLGFYKNPKVLQKLHVHKHNKFSFSPDLEEKP